MILRFHRPNQTGLLPQIAFDARAEDVDTKDNDDRVLDARLGYPGPADEHEKVRLCYLALPEFFAVVTDSRRVGNPLPPAEAWREVRTYLNAFEVLYPDEGTFAQLGRLADQYQITQQTTFDALIVAMMIQYDVKGIYTDNRKDFARFDGIEVLPSQSAATGASTAT